MLNLVASKNTGVHEKKNRVFIEIGKSIERLESKIRSNHGIGGIKVRTTGKISQLIWKRVDFIEFDKQWWSQMNQNLIEQRFHLSFNTSAPISKRRSVYPEGRGFLYCIYKYADVKNQKKLILVEKYPILHASGRSRSKIIKALNKISKILSCSKELKNISRLLKLYWEVGIKA